MHDWPILIETVFPVSHNFSTIENVLLFYYKYYDGTKGDFYIEYFFDTTTGFMIKKQIRVNPSSIPVDLSTDIDAEQLIQQALFEKYL